MFFQPETSHEENANPLLGMVTLGQLETVQNMVATNVYDINKQNEYGNCPVLEAAKSNNLQMLQILINAGARLDVADIFGNTPLTWAQKHNNTDMIALVDNCISVVVQDNTIR